MGQPIQLNNTSQPLPFLMVLSSDHITGATGKTVTVTICKSGGAFATPLGIVSETGSGWYELSASALDANTLGPLLLHATASGCDPRDSEFSVVNYNPSVVLPTSPPTSASFGTIRASDIINNACDLLGVKAAGESLGAADAQMCLGRLNRMVDGWGVQPATIPVTVREVFDLVADQADYTIGLNGDFNTTRPVWLQSAAMLQTTADPPIEIPIPIITDAMYQNIRIKELSNTLATTLYYNATYAAGLGTITLWPVPNSTVYDLVLYSLQAVAGFASLTTQYVYPPGYTEALEYNLAVRLAAPFGRTLDPSIGQLARESLAWVKRANSRMVDIPTDATVLTSSWASGYNINTGQGGGGQQ